MNKLVKRHTNRLKPIFASSVAVALTLLTASSAQAVRLKVTIENLSPEQGVFFSPFWLGFHDGSFDTFSPGEKASLPLEIVAEDGITGLESTNPEFAPLFDLARRFGAELPDPQDTIATLFATSEPDGIQDIAFANNFGFPPNSESSLFVDVNPTTHTALSYASMAVPTHDGFVADVDPIRLFSPEGTFVPQQIEIRGADVFDAGTEVNVEDPSTTPIVFDPPERFFGAVRQGTPEGGVIKPHPLLKEPGQGGFLDLPPYVNSDFTRTPNETLARITIQQVPEASSIFGILGIGLMLGFGGLIDRLRSRK
jgi:hypothetical protein